MKRYTRRSAACLCLGLTQLEVMRFHPLGVLRRVAGKPHARKGWRFFGCIVPYRGRQAELACPERAEVPLFLARLQTVQRDFRRAIEAYGNDGRARSDRRVSDQAAVGPSTGTQMPWQHRIKCEGYPAGKADLAAVGVSAQQQIKVRKGRLPIDLRRVRQQDRELLAWYSGNGLFNVVRTIEMRVIDADKMHALLLALDCFAFIEQHSDPHPLQTGNHANRIVISQYAVGRLLELRANR